MGAFLTRFASDPQHPAAEPKARLSSLEYAVYSTVAYRDVFDFAPTLSEIHRYLHSVRCEPKDVEAAIRQGRLLDQYLVSDGRLFALRGRAHILALRSQRQATVQKFWPLARAYARFLASFPHVRMVALTGSFAAQNLREDGDIDFMLLTDAGAMWRTRALAMSAALCNRKFGNQKFCPNVFLSMAALSLGRKSLYDAHELSQMVPLYGHAAYERLREANQWSEDYLPNARGAPIVAQPAVTVGLPALRAAAEWVSNSPVGKALENFEAKRKIHRFNETDRLKGTWTKSTRESHSLRDSIRQEIEDAWRQRVEALNAMEASS